MCLFEYIVMFFKCIFFVCAGKANARFFGVECLDDEIVCLVMVYSIMDMVEIIFCCSVVWNMQSVICCEDDNEVWFS